MVVKIHQHAQFQVIPSMQMPGNLSGRTEGRTDMPQNGHGWLDGQTDPCTGGKRVFQASDRRMDGWTDEQPENIMPPAPKGGRIKMP